MDGIDGVLAEPALAGHFAGGRGAMGGNGVGELLTQIKIATDAFLVEAIETEHRSRVIEVDRVFELGALCDAVGIVVRQIHCQSLQLRKFLRQAG